MLDIKFIRENPDLLDTAMKNRNAAPVSDKILAIDCKRRELMAELQKNQARRNEIAALIAKAKQNGQDSSALEKEAIEIKQTIQSQETEESVLADELRNMLAVIPNIPAADVPVGKDVHPRVERGDEADPDRHHQGDGACRQALEVAAEDARDGSHERLP